MNKKQFTLMYWSLWAIGSFVVLAITKSGFEPLVVLLTGLISFEIYNRSVKNEVNNN